MTPRFLILFICLLTPCLSVFAQKDTLIISRVTAGTTDLMPYCTAFFDEENDKKFDEIRRLTAVDFLPPGHKDTRFKKTFRNFGDYALWLKTTLHFTGQTPDSLLMTSNSAHDTELFIVPQDGSVRRAKGGKNTRLKDCSFPANRRQLPVVLQPQTVYDLYYKIIPTRDLSITELRLYYTSYAQEKADRQELLYESAGFIGFYKISLGILLFFAVFNSGIFFMVKDRAYLFYALYIFCFAVYLQSMMSNRVFPLTDSFFMHFMTAENIDNVVGAFLLLAYIFYIAFVKNFLDLTRKAHKISRRFDFLIYYLSAFILYLALERFIPFTDDFHFTLFNLGLAGFMVLSLAVLISAWNVGGKLTKFIFIGSGCFYACASFGFVLSLEIYPFAALGVAENSVLHYIFLYTTVGVLAEMIFFSVGLGYRTKITELEKQRILREKETEVSKSRLYANITHEFRTPLTIIEGNAGLILKNPYEKLETRVGTIKTYTDTLNNLINDMLDFAKLESGTAKPEMLRGNISDFTTYIVESFQSAAFNKKISLSLYSAVPDLIADYAPRALQRVLTNLLSNAVKFTPAYGKIRVVLEEKDNRLLLTVSDTGGGIAHENLTEIFRPFYRTPSAEAEMHQGTGLGLAIAEQTVKSMNGTITVESDRNRGTTFKVLLPLTARAPLRTPPRRVTSEASVSSEVEEAVPQGLGRLPKVLIVEDNPDVRRYLCDLLSGSYTILTAKNGEEGLQKAEAEQPAAIVSDEMMPVLAGFDMLKKLKENPRTRHIPVLLLTARASRAAELKGLQLEAAAYLTKPPDEEKLLALLSNAVSKKTLAAASPEDDTAPIWLEKRITDDFMRALLTVLADKHSDKNFKSIHLKYTLQKQGYGADRKIERCIKEKFGTTPAKLIRDYRLERAREMLLHAAHLSVPEIIDAAGLTCDQSYFVKMFKAQFGCTPGDASK